MVKVIIFDLGNVIIPFDFFICCRKLAQISGYTAQEVYRIGVKTELINAYETGRLSSRQFHQGVCRKLGMQLGYEDFVPIWSDIFSENQEVSALIRLLGKNQRLFLLSNTNELHFKFACEHFPVLGLFEEYILSYRLGYAKPDARIFQEAVRRAGCEPGEIVYIDDIPEYVDAAKSLGMRGIHFLSSGQLKTELARHRVSWEK